MYKSLDCCLVCGNHELIESFNLGFQPLVNNLKDSQSEDVRFPVIVNECCVCTHKQLGIAIDKRLLFSDYLYQTGTSDKHKEFFMDFVDQINNKFHYGSVLDIGCNDSSLLNEFKYRGWETLGIEPSQRFKGDNIINDFFPTKKLENKQFDIITAFNVFAHNDNPYNFLLNMNMLLKESGKIYILTTPARLDNYYHEHISYFTPQSMMFLAKECGLKVNNFLTVSMHGESYLFEMEKIKIQEYNKPNIERPFIAYGASASGIVLLNYFNLHPDYIIDDNPLKQGKWVPGINVPIASADMLNKDGRDLNILITAHHLFDDIVAKIKKVRPINKDKFIHPILGEI